MILHNRWGWKYEHTFTGEEIAYGLKAHLTDEQVDDWIRARGDVRFNGWWWQRLWYKLRLLITPNNSPFKIVSHDRSGAEKIVYIEICRGEYQACLWYGYHLIEDDECKHFEELGRHPYSTSCTECVEMYNKAARLLNNLNITVRSATWEEAQKL